MVERALLELRVAAVTGVARLRGCWVAGLLGCWTLTPSVCRVTQQLRNSGLSPHATNPKTHHPPPPPPRQPIVSAPPRSAPHPTRRCRSVARTAASPRAARRRYRSLRATDASGGVRGRPRAE